MRQFPSWAQFGLAVLIGAGVVVGVAVWGGSADDGASSPDEATRSVEAVDAPVGEEPAGSTSAEATSTPEPQPSPEPTPEPQPTPAPTPEPTTEPTPAEPASPAPTPGVGAGVASVQATLASVEAGDVEFVAGSAELTSSGRAALSEIATVLVANPQVPVEIVVRTYTEPTPGQNHGLSTQQAGSILAHLVANDIDEQRLSAVGVGSPPGTPPGRNGVLLVDTSDEDLAAELRRVNTLAIDLTPDGTVTADGLLALDQTAEALRSAPDASLTLVAYAYDAESSDGNHDRAHVLADAAVAHLVGAGVDLSRLATLGLGDATVNLELETAVTFEAGPRAAVSIALAQIDTEGIDFEERTATLSPRAQTTLDEVTAAMSIDLSSIVDVAAHTYSETTSQDNHDLSHDQGDAVVQRIVDAGIDPDRFRLVGHGDPPQFFEPGRNSYITFTVAR